MTPDKTPTDSEILDAAEDFRSQYKHGGTTFDDFDALAFGRAVLAVEAEARAQDTALIRQLVEALEGHQGNYKLTAREAAPVNDAITAGCARLKEIAP